MKVEIRIPTQEELEKMDVKSWPIWEKEESRFDWHYDEKEVCFFLEGDVEIELSNGEKINVKKGDFATFPKGLSCRWNIKKKVKKHYNFG